MTALQSCHGMCTILTDWVTVIKIDEIWIMSFKVFVKWVPNSLCKNQCNLASHFCIAHGQIFGMGSGHLPLELYQTKNVIIAKFYFCWLFYAFSSYGKTLLSLTSSRELSTLWWCNIEQSLWCNIRQWGPPIPLILSKIAFDECVCW